MSTKNARARQSRYDLMRLCRKFYALQGKPAAKWRATGSKNFVICVFISYQ